MKNNFVDAVFTNNVLIHISPEDLPKVLSEMHRVTKKYIHLTLIASETSGDATFVKDTIVKNDHENGTVQSYYDINKINL